MPTGQNANRTKCQPKVGILSGLFSVVGILSVPTFWLAFCPDHLNMFQHFFQIMKIIFQITFHKIAKSICKTGSDDSSWGQIESAFAELFSMRKSLGNKLTQFVNFFSECKRWGWTRIGEQIKSLVRELQQIKGDSGVRAKLLLWKWAAAEELDTDTTLDCKECGKTFANSANLRRHTTT